MKKIIELRGLKTEKIDRLKVLSLELETRSLTTDESAELETINTELETINTEIALLEKTQRALAAAAGVVRNNFDGEEKEIAKYSLGKVVRQLYKGQSVDGLEAELADEANSRNNEFNGNGFTVPSRVLRTMSATGGSGLQGANTISTEIGGLIEFLGESVIYDKVGAEILSGLKGNLNLPKESTASNAFWEGEISAADSASRELDKIELRPNRLAAFIPLTYQLMAQSEYTMETWAANSLRTGISAAVNRGYFHGTGIGQPSGLFTLLTAAGGRNVPIATNGGQITWDLIVALESLVNAGNAVGNTYITNSKVLGKLKTIKKDAGSGMFLFNELSPSAPLNGNALAISNAIASNLAKASGTNLSGMLFGDFSKTIVGNWGDIYLDMESKAKEGQKELIVNSFWDFKIKNDNALSFINDIVTT